MVEGIGVYIDGIFFRGNVQILVEGMGRFLDPFKVFNRFLLVLYFINSLEVLAGFGLFVKVARIFVSS